MSTNSLPPPPFFDIKPDPDQIALCPREKLVFGFPVSFEWFSVLYQSMKKKREVQEYSKEFLSTITALANVCQSLYPQWPHFEVVSVASGGYGEFGSCTLIMVGVAGWRPPQESVEEIAKELRKYGLVEKPGWFPGLGMKSTFQNILDITKSSPAAARASLPFEGFMWRRAFGKWGGEMNCEEEDRT